MNKRIVVTIVILCVLALLTVAILLVGRGCDRLPQGATPAQTQQTTEASTADTTEEQIGTEAESTTLEDPSESVDETLSAVGGFTERDDGNQTTPTVPADTKVPEQTEPAGTEAPVQTEPTQDNEVTLDPETMTYEDFMQLSSAEKVEFAKNFTDEEFVDWYNKVKLEYEQSRPEIEITGPINPWGDATQP